MGGASKRRLIARGVRQNHMPNRQIFIILLLSSSLSLGQKIESGLNDFFSVSEIQDLNLIADFVQEELCGSSDRRLFADCITNSIPDLVDLKQNYIQEKISWRKQKKLYSSISDSTFKKIWALCDTWQTIKPEYKYKVLCFSGNPVFIDFVNSLSETSPAIEGYADRLAAIGDFGYLRQTFYNIAEYPDSTDLNNRGVQILMAIRFLTENDNAKRDKKANRLEKKHFRNLKKGKEN